MAFRNKDTFYKLKRRMAAARARPRGFRMLKPRTRWHVLFRRVLANKHWLELAADLEHSAATSSRRLIRAAMAEMSPADKALLRRPVEERTDEEMETLSRRFSGLRCFRHYPEVVRRQLAMFVSLECYGANRIIVKQDHLPQAMYFVISGQLEMWRTEKDPVLGEEMGKPISIGPGESFGSLTLLRNVPRSRTVASKTIVELLLLRKHDFDTVLKATIMKEWVQIKNALTQFPYFDDYTEADVQDVCIQSKLLNYSDGEIILGDGFGMPNMSYFVVEGKAILIQHLIIVPKKAEIDIRPSKYSPDVRCMPPGTPMDHPNGECVFMQVAELDKGECFSLGEDMTDRRIIAQGPTKMLLIPLYFLIGRNRGHLWRRIRDFLDRRLLPQKELFLLMLNGRDWLAYRHALRNSLPTRPGNLTTIHDVPLSYRVAHDIPPIRYSAYTLERAEHPRKYQWIIKRKKRAKEDAQIAAAKLEYQFDEEFTKKFGDQVKASKAEISKHDESVFPPSNIGLS